MSNSIFDLSLTVIEIYKKPLDKIETRVYNSIKAERTPVFFRFQRGI